MDVVEVWVVVQIHVKAVVMVVKVDAVDHHVKVDVKGARTGDQGVKMSKVVEAVVVVNAVNVEVNAVANAVANVGVNAEVNVEVNAEVIAELVVVASHMKEIPVENTVKDVHHVVHASKIVAETLMGAMFLMHPKSMMNATSHHSVRSAES